VQLALAQFIEMASARSIFVSGKPKLVYFPVQIGAAEREKMSGHGMRRWNEGMDIMCGDAHVILAIFPASETLPDVCDNISSTYSISARCTAEPIDKSDDNSAGTAMLRRLNSARSMSNSDDDAGGCLAAAD
jgi:hypothetical protein